MKVVYCGRESQGKTLFLSEKLTELLKRNIKWKRKYGFTRLIYTNMAVGKRYYQKYQEFIRYWSSVQDVIGLAGCDILWDEMSSDFSSMKKEPLGKEINRWLRQGAKQGVHIYATVQEFHDLHLDARRRFQDAWSCRKLFGSARGGLNLPPVKRLWGFCYKRKLKINPYNELQPEVHGWPSFVWIGKKLCSVFDTYQVIKASLEETPLEHITRKCRICGIEKLIHR